MLQDYNRMRRIPASARFMLAAALCYSLIPLLSAWSGAAANPALFNGIWRAGALGGYLLWIRASCPPTAGSWPSLKTLVSGLSGPRLRWLVLLAWCSAADYALFAWAAGRSGAAAAAVVFEIWPAGAVLLLSALERRPVSRRLTLILVLGFAGTVLAGLGRPDAAFSGLLPALLPGLLAAMVSSLAVAAFRCGSLLAEEVALPGADADETARLGALSVFVLGNFAAAPASLAFGLLAGGPVFPLWTAAALLPGGLLLAGGAVCWQRANAGSAGPGINSLGYLTPVLSLLWLYGGGYAGDVRWEFLLAGAAVVALSNVLLLRSRPG